MGTLRSMYVGCRLAEGVVTLYLCVCGGRISATGPEAGSPLTHAANCGAVYESREWAHAVNHAPNAVDTASFSLKS